MKRISLIFLFLHIHNGYAQQWGQESPARLFLTRRLIQVLQTSNDINQVANLLSEGALINESDPATGYTPIMAALTNPGVLPQTIAFLLQRGAALDVRGNLGESPFLIAAERVVNPTIINLLLRPNPLGIGGSDVAVNDNLGRTGLNFLLQHAVYMRNNPQAYQAIVASINLVFDALMRLASISPDVVRSSLNMRGTFYTLDGQQAPSTTLMWLAWLGDAQLYDQFINRFRGFLIPNVQDSLGRTAYDWASNNLIRQRIIALGTKPGSLLTRPAQ